MIAEQAVENGKAGPRIRDVLDHIIDLPSLVELEEPAPSGDLFTYILIQGLDSQQTAQQIHRRFSLWMNSYDQQQPNPIHIHVFSK